MSDWLADLVSYTRANEGLRLDAYDDATGKPVLPGQHVAGTLTIGYGHTGHDVFPGLTWTEAHADAVFLRDLAVAIGDAEPTFGQAVFAGMSAARKIAFCDVAFELGEYGLEGFQHMIENARAGDWAGAAKELVNSRLDAEVPARVKRNAVLIDSGIWPGA